MRSLLLVPVADAAALAASLASQADALVFCLGEPSDPGRAATRDAACAALRAARAKAEPPSLYIGLSGLDREAFDTDLAALMPGEPDGVLLGRAARGADVQHLGAKLAVAEADLGLEGGTLIIAEAAAHAGGVFGLGSYGGASARLMGLTWNAATLADDLGGDPAEADGPLGTVRHLTLLAARAAGVAAVDTASATADDARFADECRLARRLGFNAKLACSPAQAAVINAVFAPTPE